MAREHDYFFGKRHGAFVSEKQQQLEPFTSQLPSYKEVELTNKSPDHICDLTNTYIYILHLPWLTIWIHLAKNCVDDQIRFHANISVNAKMQSYSKCIFVFLASDMVTELHVICSKGIDTIANLDCELTIYSDAVCVYGWKCCIFCLCTKHHSLCYLCKAPK